MSTFKSQVKKPFLNLTPRARLLQVIRLGSAALSVIFLLIIICLDLKSMPVARLDCSHVEVANGLFSALQSTVSTGAVGVFEGSDVSLTTSQVLILTEYVQQQVEDAPQFIDSNMMNWCFGNYNYTSEVVNGETFYKKKPLFYKCTDVDKNYVFDYRGELSTIGLNIILAYAYSDSSFSAESLTDSVQYQPDEAYLKTLNERRKSTKAVPGLFYSTVCLQTLLLVLGIIYYGKRNYAKDDTDMPMVIRQCFAVLSLTAFLTFLAGLCLTTKIYFEIQTSVRQELGAFGLSVHLGKSWFGMTWTNMVICLLSMLGWCGPLWCGNIQPKKSLAENDVYMRERDYIGTPLRNRAAGFDTFAFTPSSDEYLAEHKQLSSENTDHGTTYDFSEQSTESPDLGRSLTLGKSKYTRERSQSLGKLLNPSGIPRSNSQKYKGVVSFRDGDYGRDIFLDENNGLVFGDAVSFEEHYMHDGTCMFANRVSILQPAEATHEALAQTFGSNCAFPFGGDFVGDGARSDRFGETGSRTDEVKSHSFSGVNTDMNTNSMFAKGNVEGANVFGQKSSVFAGAPPLNSDTNGLPEEFGRSSLSDNRSSPFGSSERISTSVSPFSNQRSARTVFSSVSPTKQFLLEKPLEQPKKFSSSHKQIIAIGILICVFFLVVPLGTVITVPSCQSSSSYCIPQLSMRWMDSDSNTHAAFSSARDAASLLGYLAEDLSSDNDDDTSTLQELINANKDGDPEGPPSYLGTIDTFSLDNVFEIGYWGYCRKNLKTGKSFCNKCMGLDIPSVLVRDAGIQLGDVSNHFNPSVLGKSFVTAYYATLRSLKELPGVAGEVIRNALLIRNTAIAIAILISAEFVLSSLNMLIFLFLVAMVSFDRSFYFIKARLFATLSVTAGIQFVVMLLGFSIAAGQTEYTYTLSQAVDTSGFASVSYGYGNYIAWAKFFSSCVVFVSMLAILVKKPWNPKYRDIAYKN